MDGKSSRADPSTSSSKNSQQPDKTDVMYPLMYLRETFIDAISKFSKTAGELIEIPEEDLRVDVPPESDDMYPEKKSEVQSSKTDAKVKDQDEEEASALNETMDFDLAGW